MTILVYYLEFGLTLTGCFVFFVPRFKSSPLKVREVNDQIHELIFNWGPAGACIFFTCSSVVAPILFALAIVNFLLGRKIE